MWQECQSSVHHDACHSALKLPVGTGDAANRPPIATGVNCPLIAFGTQSNVRAGLNPPTWTRVANDRDRWEAIALQVKPKNSRKSSKAPTARPAIKLGTDGYDERCYNCLQIGRRNHPRGELACCGAPNCTAVWHACCVSVA